MSLIENSYINRLYNEITKHNNVDFVIPNKKPIHEGIFLTKTKSWKKINNLQKIDTYKSIRIGCECKKKFVQKCYLKIYKSEIKNNF